MNESGLKVDASKISECVDISGKVDRHGKRPMDFSAGVCNTYVAVMDIL